MAEIRVLSVKSLEPGQLEKLRQISSLMSVSQVTCDTPEEVASHLHDVDILYTFDASFP